MMVTIESIIVAATPVLRYSSLDMAVEEERSVSMG